MKKFIKILTKSLCLLFIATFATFSVVGCGNKNKNTNNNADNSASQQVSTEKDPVADNVTENEAIVVEGIFKLSRNASYKDIYWNDANNTIIDYYKTKDINGVYNELRKLGFENFAAHTTNYNNAECEMLVNFTAEAIEFIIEDGENYLAISSVSRESFGDLLEIVDANTVVIHEQFFTTENEVKTNHPVFVKFTFEKITATENIPTENI